MTHPDFRALCAELVEKIDYTWGDTPEDVLQLMGRARAALSAPQQGASLRLEQLDDLCAEHGFHYDDDESLDVLRDVISAALTRYGAQAVPVAVGEGLPKEGDCDALGRCWWFTPKEGNIEPFRCADWSFYAGWRQKYTHWLPHWALPLPEAQP